MDTKKVAAAIILSGETVLLTRRKQGKKLAGYWEFPGGKIEENETVQECLEREIHEELNINIKAGKRIVSNIHIHPHGVIELIALEAKIVSGITLGKDAQVRSPASLKDNIKNKISLLSTLYGS